MKRNLRVLPKKVWERLTGIEPRRLWLELINTQNELTNTQNELTNTQNELTNTQNELQASRSALKELGIASIELFESVENKNAEKSVDVTVMIATKNRFKLLLRALESINQQSQLPLEIIVVNNGEKFSKKEVAEISRACCSVSRVQFLDGQHLPDLSSLRELGLQKVSTKYAAYLDDDNVMWPRWIENAFKFISKHDLSFVYGSQLREDSDSHYFYQEFSKDKIRETNLIQKL